MARSKDKLSANLNAFLDAIAWAEGTSTNELTRDDGYDVIVTGVLGKELFFDYSEHPFAKGRRPKQINERGLYSTASGRYQHMLKDWIHYKNLLGLKDFGPESQDVWAIQLIRERRSLSLIETGDIKSAVGLVRNLWASLPGAGYGQSERSIKQFIDIYLSKGGTLWDSDLKYTRELPQLLPQSVHILPEVSELKQKLKPMPESKLPNVWQKLIAMLQKLRS